MKRKDILNLNAALNECLELDGNIKFRYGIMRNRDAISKEINILKQIEEENRKIIKDFDEERNVLILKYGKELKNGTVQIAVNDENFPKYEKELKPLEEKYKEELKKYDESMKEYVDKILDEDIDTIPAFFMINVDNIPDSITNGALNMLMTNGIIKDY